MTDIEKLIKLLEHAESFSLEAYGKSPNLSECSLNIQYLRACILQAIGNAKALRERLANDKTDRELLEQVLEALELHAKQYPHMQKGYTVDAITAVRERLAQPEQEPVAWLSTDSIGERYLWFSKPLDNDKAQPLYTAPQKREWQGLTENEMKKLADTHLKYQPESYEVSGVFDLIRAVEAKLKEKNT